MRGRLLKGDLAVEGEISRAGQIDVFERAVLFAEADFEGIAALDFDGDG